MLTVENGYGATYYTGGSGKGATPSYYLNATVAGDPPGQWRGAGAAALGLDGEVDNRVYEAMYDRFIDPRDGRVHDRKQWRSAERLGGPPRRFKSDADRIEAWKKEHPQALPEELEAFRAQVEKSARDATYFTDLTFGVPKSVTVLHAAYAKAELEAQRAGNLDEAAQWAGRRHKVEAAVWAGNQAMLDYMAERAAFTRVTKGSGSEKATRWEPTPQWIVAAWWQTDNRDLEPHLHIHNTAHARVQLPDGKWMSLDGKALRHHKQAGGIIGERTMQEYLRRELGIDSALNKAGHTREVAGMDSKVSAKFSKRTQKITERTAKIAAELEAATGMPLTPLQQNHLKQASNHVLRRAKAKGVKETPEESLDRWHALLRADLAGGLLRVAARFSQTAPTPKDAQARAAIDPVRVIAKALDAVQEGASTWTRPQLIKHLDLALPDSLGGADGPTVTRLLEALADAAVSSEEVVQLAGHHLQDVPAELRRADGASVYASPRAEIFATRQHVLAEEALRRAAVVRDRHKVPTGEANAWLAAREDMLFPDQVAAVKGLLSSGAAMSVVLGVAGAGKSHVGGALGAAWPELTGGRVFGVAPTQKAADILAEDGIGETANMKAWLLAQSRIAGSRAGETDEQWRLTATDIVFLDEASMVDTRTLGMIRDRVEAAGARLVLAGDSSQLSAVAAGGMLKLIVGGEAARYDLSDVRRFREPWERAASLELREGKPEAVREYDRHGRVMAGGKATDAMDMVTRGYVADRLRGLRSIIVTATNDEAEEVSGRVRRELVRLGVVAEEGVLLGKDGNTAGVADLIAVRKIDWDLRVVNRRQYEVLETREDGGLKVAAVGTGQVVDLPAGFVAEHVTLGYAGTVHSAQGATVDTSWALTGGKSWREQLYVAMTRGRIRNTAVVITEGEVDFGKDPHARSARGILVDVLEREGSELAALAVKEMEDADAASASTLDARVEDAVRFVARLRMEDHLDRMVEDGLLGEGQRARLGAEQGAEYLSRVLRGCEQAGQDPEQVLRDAVTGKDLDGARSLSQVISARITVQADLSETQQATVPAGVSPEMARYLGALHALKDVRTAQLAAEAAAEPPAWALEAFGPAPDDPAELSSWMVRVGAVAVHREASSWDGESPVGPGPGVHSTERRASWHRAWEALGRPTEQAEEADLSDGRLMNRVAAWERLVANAPDFVDSNMRAAALAALRGAQEQAFAAAEGRQVADEEVAKAAEAEAVVEPLDVVAKERGKWFAAGAMTREAAERAAAELARRGVDLADTSAEVAVEDYLAEVRRDEANADAGTEVVQVVVQRPAPVEEVAEDVVPTVDQAERMRGRADWMAQVLADWESSEASYFGDGEKAEWDRVREESARWEAQPVEDAHDQGVLQYPDVWSAVSDDVSVS